MKELHKWNRALEEERDDYEKMVEELQDTINTMMNNGSHMQAYTEMGSITFFPSYMPHRVTPVTEGERWVIVVWVHGSTRFR